VSTNVVPPSADTNARLPVEAYETVRARGTAAAMCESICLSAARTRDACTLSCAGMSTTVTIGALLPPLPKLRVIETEGMNAFASGLHEGRFNVTVTRGLLQHLDRDELEAVLAHELTHILNRDVRTMVIAAVFAGIITLICQIIYRTILWGGSWGGRSRRGNLGVFFLVAIVVAAVGYLLAIVIRMAISRTREYVADAGSVELTKNPDAMISALQKVAGHTHLDAPQSMRAMFLEDDDEGIMGLFATHPPVGKRIEALMRYGGGRAAEPKPAAAAPSTAAPVTPQSAPSDGPWGAPAGGEPGPWS